MKKKNIIKKYIFPIILLSSFFLNITPVLAEDDSNSSSAETFISKNDESKNAENTTSVNTKIAESIKDNEVYSVSLKDDDNLIYSVPSDEICLNSNVVLQLQYYDENNNINTFSSSYIGKIISLNSVFYYKINNYKEITSNFDKESNNLYLNILFQDENTIKSSLKVINLSGLDNDIKAYIPLNVSNYLITGNKSGVISDGNITENTNDINISDIYDKPYFINDISYTISKDGKTLIINIKEASGSLSINSTAINKLVFYSNNFNKGMNLNVSILDKDGNIIDNVNDIFDSKNKIININDYFPGSYNTNYDAETNTLNIIKQINTNKNNVTIQFDNNNEVLNDYTTYAEKYVVLDTTLKDVSGNNIIYKSGDITEPYIITIPYVVDNAFINYDNPVSLKELNNTLYVYLNTSDSAALTIKNKDETILYNNNIVKNKTVILNQYSSDKTTLLNSIKLTDSFDGSSVIISDDNDNVSISDTELLSNADLWKDAAITNDDFNNITYINVYHDFDNNIKNSNELWTANINTKSSSGEFSSIFSKEMSKTDVLNVKLNNNNIIKNGLLTYDNKAINLDINDDIITYTAVEKDGTIIVTPIFSNKNIYHTLTITFKYPDDYDGEKSEPIEKKCQENKPCTYIAPVITGYTANKQNIKIDSLTEDKTETIEYTKEDTSITIHYTDKNGKQIADDTIINFNMGDQYYFEAPDIYGYIKPADAVYYGTINEKMSLTFVYDINTEIQKYNLHVSFSSDDLINGDTVPSSVDLTCKADEICHYDIPQMINYTSYVNDEEKTSIDEIISEDSTINVNYKRKQFTLIIRYLDASTNKSIIDDEKQLISYQSVYNVKAKDLECYKLTGTSSYKDTMPFRDVSVVFRYSKKCDISKDSLEKEVTEKTITTENKNLDENEINLDGTSVQSENVIVPEQFSKSPSSSYFTTMEDNLNLNKKNITFKYNDSIIYSKDFETDIDVIVYDINGTIKINKTYNKTIAILLPNNENIISWKVMEENNKILVSPVNSNNKATGGISTSTVTDVKKIGYYTKSSDVKGGKEETFVLINHKYTIPEKPVFYKDGYTLIGYSMSGDNLEVSFTPGQTLTITDNLSLYPVFVKNVENDYNNKDINNKDTYNQNFIIKPDNTQQNENSSKENKKSNEIFNLFGALGSGFDILLRK